MGSIDEIIFDRLQASGISIAPVEAYNVYRNMITHVDLDEKDYEKYLSNNIDYLIERHNQNELTQDQLVRYLSSAKSIDLWLERRDDDKVDHEIISDLYDQWESMHGDE